MTDMITDVIIDSLKMLPFLFAAYLLIELLEKHAEDKTVEWVHKAGSWGPLIGGLLGVVPQCGFSVATANLYAGGIITRGTLLAVFLSTSDEMLPIMLSKQAAAALITRILLIKMLVGIAAGFITDLAEKRSLKNHSETIHDICEQEGCNCEEGVLKSALFHTSKIFLFILLTSLVVSAAVYFVGTDRLAGFITNKPVIGELISILIGLIPNCAASVIITELYLQGGMTAGAMIAGLLAGSGMGLLILFRMHKDLKDNLKSLAILCGTAFAVGIIVDLIPGLF